MDKSIDLFVDKSRPIDKTHLWMRAKGSLINYFMDKSKDLFVDKSRNIDQTYFG